VQMWNMQQSEADLFFKLIYSGMWTVSMMLIWMMLNKIAKLFSQTFPDNKPIKGFYKFMVSLRPYQLYYNVSIGVLANTGILYYYLSKQEKQPF